MDFDESGEKLKFKSSVKVKKTASMTLSQAIELGEYSLEILSTFSEFLNLSRHGQFQMVRQALENRRHQLLTQYAETSNIMDFSKKPELKEALNNINNQLKKVEKDREEIYVAFAKVV